MCQYLFYKIFCSSGSHMFPFFSLQILPPSHSFPPFSPSFLSPVHSLEFTGFFFRFSYLPFYLSRAMLFQTEEAVHLPYSSVLETMLSESEIQYLFSLINQSGDPASPSSGSQGSNREVYSAEERKLRRMQSNRESARRSRCKKKKHLENMRNRLNRLRMENRELKNQLAFTMHQHLLLSLQNDRLLSESVALLATLSDLCAILTNTINMPSPSSPISHINQYIFNKAINYQITFIAYINIYIIIHTLSHNLAHDRRYN